MIHLWPDRMAGRIILPVIIIVIGAQFALSWFFFSAFEEDYWPEEQALYAEQQRDRLRSLIVTLRNSPKNQTGDILKVANGKDFHAWLASDTAAFEDKQSLQAVEAKHAWAAELQSADAVKIIVSSFDFDDLETLHSALALPDALIVNYGGHPPDLLIEAEIRPRVWLRVLSVSSEFDSEIADWFDIYDLIYLCLIIVSVVPILIFVVRRAAQPIHALAGFAERIGHGGWRHEEIPETGPLETRQAARALNVMAQRIHDFVEDRTRMLAAISHDIASPLTGMRLQAEMVEDAEIRESLIRGIEEISDMSRSTLAFARLDTSDEKSQPMHFAEFVADLLKDYEHETIAFDASTAAGSLVVPIRRTLMRRALRNIVDNALKHGGSATFHLASHDGEIRLDISDTGPGLPESLLEKVFEPFYRFDYSRNPDSGGTGLGLSIARNLIRLHGGDIQLCNRAGGGLTARITLPTG
ncbi:HAMP domain-containing sensor histidine kinase [Pelagibius sp. Alg239-R121]|uniref:sensor histidine kinase n=1 Tax=Pelagibius sp. Alg239-R121 TaxID=2993448 RepID=UPI0024A71AB5|nr:HAMP domain-containing sensor histidine kinase [Pelagibius sp. Alg239-R121]